MSAQPIADGITEAFKAGYVKASIESAAKIAELEKACAEFVADARRYRWLREDAGRTRDYYSGAPWVIRIEKPNGVPTMQPVYEVNLDMAIDAALSASRAGGQGEGK